MTDGAFSDSSGPFTSCSYTSLVWIARFFSLQYWRYLYSSLLPSISFFFSHVAIYKLTAIDPRLRFVLGGVSVFVLSTNFKLAIELGFDYSGILTESFAPLCFDMATWVNADLWARVAESNFFRIGSFSYAKDVVDCFLTCLVSDLLESFWSLNVLPFGYAEWVRISFSSEPDELSISYDCGLDWSSSSLVLSAPLSFLYSFSSNFRDLSIF